MPEMTSVAVRLPAGGGVTGTVVITAAALPGAVLAQFTVSAVIELVGLLQLGEPGGSM